MKAPLKILIAITLLPCLISCTAKRTLHQIGVKNVYLEKQGKFCNLFYKNKTNKYTLVADSVVYVQAYDSIFAYSRVAYTTYPDMTIVKVGKDEQFYKKEVDGLEYEKVFPTFFSFPVRADISIAPEMYDFIDHHEIIISDENIIPLN